MHTEDNVASFKPATNKAATRSTKTCWIVLRPRQTQSSHKQCACIYITKSWSILYMHVCWFYCPLRYAVAVLILCFNPAVAGRLRPCGSSRCHLQTCFNRGSHKLDESCLFAIFSITIARLGPIQQRYLFQCFFDHVPPPPQVETPFGMATCEGNGT